MITRVSFVVCFLWVVLVNAKLNRIIGGEHAQPGQFKYQIFLQDNRGTLCGGAIIADQYVLTAAHCVVNEHGIFASRYAVIAGSTNVMTGEGVRVGVEKIFVPRMYSAQHDRNDIAVLKLRRGLGLGTNLNLHHINLPPKEEATYVGHPAVISGYGYTQVSVRINPTTHREEVSNGFSDGKLKYAMTNIISNEECHRKNDLYKVGKDQICAQAVRSGGKPSAMCNGDSGGPLVSGNIIIGVASLTPPGCNEEIIPSIYTKVSSYIDFITKAMNNARTSDMIIWKMSRGESSSGSGRGH